MNGQVVLIAMLLPVLAGLRVLYVAVGVYEFCYYRCEARSGLSSSHVRTWWHG